eukprot:m.89364 g.89364  ORF g.89364 m.89364 type:complete len:222 (-) comp13214_c2_seq1:1526-2191(-)
MTSVVSRFKERRRSSSEKKQGTGKGVAFETTDREIRQRMKEVTNGVTHSLHQFANEPSLGLFRVQEHIQRSVPEITERKRMLQGVTRKIQGACYDVEFALGAVQKMHEITAISNIQKDMLKAISIQQQLRARAMILQEQNKSKPPKAPAIEEAKAAAVTTDVTPNTSAAPADANEPTQGKPQPIQDGEAPPGEGVNTADGAVKPKKKKKKTKKKDIVTKSF